MQRPLLILAYPRLSGLLPVTYSVSNTELNIAPLLIDERHEFDFINIVYSLISGRFNKYTNGDASCPHNFKAYITSCISLCTKSSTSKRFVLFIYIYFLRSILPLELCRKRMHIYVYDRYDVRGQQRRRANLSRVE